MKPLEAPTQKTTSDRLRPPPTPEHRRRAGKRKAITPRSGGTPSQAKLLCEPIKRSPANGKTETMWLVGRGRSPCPPDSRAVILIRRRRRRSPTPPSNNRVPSARTTRPQPGPPPPSEDAALTGQLHPIHCLLVFAASSEQASLQQGRRRRTKAIGEVAAAASAAPPRSPGLTALTKRPAKEATGSTTPPWRAASWWRKSRSQLIRRDADTTQTAPHKLLLLSTDRTDRTGVPLPSRRRRSDERRKEEPASSPTADKENADASLSPRSEHCSRRGEKL